MLENYFKYIIQNYKFRIKRNKQVIDIGSGHSPLIRADILCDFFPLKTCQRAVTGIYTPPNRFVVGDVQELPFCTKAFDFSFSRAVLEHVSDPLKACHEISRIAKEGLLILPSYLWEIMGGSKAHIWLIARKKDKLEFQRKTLKHVELSSNIPTLIRDSKYYEKLFAQFYEKFYINFYWKNHIEVEVLDDGKNTYFFEDEKQTIVPENFKNKFSPPMNAGRKSKILLYEMLRKFLGGRNIDIFSVIACPSCKKKFSDTKNNFLICGNCNIRFPIVEGVPFLIKECAVKN